MFIESTYNTTARAPAVLIGSSYQLSLFLRDDPSTLIDSIDTFHLDTIGNLQGCPTCLEMKASSENDKAINFCFEDLTTKESWELAFEKWNMCRKGQDLKEAEVSILNNACQKKADQELEDLFSE